MKVITLKHLYIEKHKVEYEFSCPNFFLKFLKSEECKIKIEYPNCDLTQIPHGVLMIPFVGNILTVSMLLDIDIQVPVIDKVFFESLPRIKDSFKKMYPYLKLNFNVKTDRIEDCTYNVSSKKSLFFTGGLDATSAMIETYNEKPILINIWGGDTNTKDLESHNHLEVYLKKISASLDLQYQFIKSNCREMYNEPKVSKFLATRILPWNNHGWWASIAHILAMTTLISPFAYEKRIGIHYIGSSYDNNSKTFDANNDLLLNSIKFCSCSLESIDNNLTRIDKAQKTIEFSQQFKLPLELYVCWYKVKGKNCSHCEKCYRTILDIIVNKGDPNQYGFNVDAQTYADMNHFLSNNYVNKGYWNSIIDCFKKEQDYWQNIPEMKWILSIKLNSTKSLIKKILSTVKRMSHIK